MKALTESQQLLSEAEWTMRDFVYWPTTHHYTLGALWVAAASLRDSERVFKPYAIGRPLFTSEEGNTGKSLSTQVLIDMVPGGRMMVNPTAYGMQAMLASGGCPGWEELDKKTGPRALRATELMSIALSGYTIRGETLRERGDKEDWVNVHGPMVLNANNANAIMSHVNFDPLRTRSHIFLLNSCPSDVELTEYDPELHDADFAELRRRFQQWGVANWHQIVNIPTENLGMDKRIRNRQKQIWKILFRVAHFVGGEWPERCQAAAKALVLGIYGEEDTPVVSSTEEILWAVRATFCDGDEWLSTDTILDRLEDLPQRPRKLDTWETERAAAMGVSKCLRVYGIEHTRRSVDGEQQWGYSHADLYEDGEVPVVQ